MIHIKLNILAQAAGLANLILPYCLLNLIVFENPNTSGCQPWVDTASIRAWVIYTPLGESEWYFLRKIQDEQECFANGFCNEA